MSHKDEAVFGGDWFPLFTAALGIDPAGVEEVELIFETSCFVALRVLRGDKWEHRIFPEWNGIVGAKAALGLPYFAQNLTVRAGPKLFLVCEYRFAATQGMADQLVEYLKSSNMAEAAN